MKNLGIPGHLCGENDVSTHITAFDHNTLTGGDRLGRTPAAVRPQNHRNMQFWPPQNCSVRESTMEISNLTLKKWGSPYLGVPSTILEVNFVQFPTVGVRHPLKVNFFGFTIKSLVDKKILGTLGQSHTQNDTQIGEMAKFFMRNNKWRNSIFLWANHVS